MLKIPDSKRFVFSESDAQKAMTKDRQNMQHRYIELFYDGAAGGGGGGGSNNGSGGGRYGGNGPPPHAVSGAAYSTGTGAFGGNGSRGGGGNGFGNGYGNYWRDTEDFETII